jgi:PKD repeat protein
MNAMCARVCALAVYLLSLFLSPLAWGEIWDPAQTSFGASTPWNAVVTYQSIGLYWKPSGVTSGKAMVRFRPKGATDWRDGHELWFDARNNEFRGSLVELESDTGYEIQLKHHVGTEQVQWTDWTSTLLKSCDDASARECKIPATESRCTSDKRTQCTRTWRNVDFANPAATDPVLDKESVNANLVNSQGQLVITRGGSDSQGYVVYEGPYTITLTEGSGLPCVVVNANFVVIRNLVLEGCGTHGIDVSNASDVIIEDNEIRGWGRIDSARTASLRSRFPTPPLAENQNAAVFCGNDPDQTDESRTHRIVVQRNNIHSPRYSSESWKRISDDDDIDGQTHPKGAVGLNFSSCGWNHVVRWNDIAGAGPAQSVTISTVSDRVSWTAHGLPEGTAIQITTTGTLPTGLTAGRTYYVKSRTNNDFQLSTTPLGAAIELSGSSQSGVHTATPQRFFKDGLGGGPNLNENDAKAGGFPWADSDLYGNRFSHVYDDAISAEGRNRNVRIWANYFDRIYQGVANSANARGPLYVWRNVSNWMANMYCTDCDSDDGDRRGAMIKAGGEGSFNGGIAYYYHNTLLQPPQPSDKDFPMGARFGINGSKTLYNFVSRNNIWHVYRTTEPPQPKPGIMPNHASIMADCSSTTPCSPPTPDNGPAADYDVFNYRIENMPSTAEATSRSLNPSWGPAAAGGGDERKVPAYRNAVTQGCSPVNAACYPSKIPSEANNWTGDFRLVLGSLGATGAAALLPNFNDLDSTRHVGAQAPNTETMRFGRAAADGPRAVLSTTLDEATGRVIFDASESSGGTAGIKNQGLRLEFDHNSQAITWTDKNVPQEYVYPPGTYHPKLTVTDNSIPEKTASTTKQITVPQSPSCAGPKPTAKFTATPQFGNKPLTVDFNASASSAVSPATITDYNITYSDNGASGTGVTQSHTYQNAGSYLTTLVVTDSNQCQSDPEMQWITVTEPGKPAFRAASSAATDTSSLSIARPNTAPNDVMIASIGVRPATVTIGVPAGWTLVRRIDNGTHVSLVVFRKVSGTSEPVSYSWDVTGATWAAGGIQSFVNVDTVNPIDVEAGQATPTSLSHSTPSVTTTVANTMVITSHTFATSTTWTQPTGMTEAFDTQFQPVEQNLGLSIEGNHVVQATVGATGTKTATAAGGSGAEGAGATHILALRPAVTLQQGINGYGVPPNAKATADTRIMSFKPDTNEGSIDLISIERETQQSILIRFAIFAADGGPVPDNATITSATLSLYKFSGPAATIKASRLKRNWSEAGTTGATWNVAAAGISWEQAGAFGASDVEATADGEGTVGDATVDGCLDGTAAPAACWLHINVTSGVQAFKNGTLNHGWKLAYVSGGNPSDQKDFKSSEHPNFLTLRPKLTVTYTPAP